MTSQEPTMLKKNMKQRGATMVEYALIIVAVALVAYVGAEALGLSLKSKFSSIASCVGS